ncbi:aspartate kinase [Thalassotalea euphylliae]|uniref:Aspartokinase n=1 Tax=Thalassotalea euphylliae TaxID=1655234 RepID=A0A3E0UD05_9GAMM|nr:aspartate kinase [Thalassotalea euphylliae]REL34467.1 aspartate kinase [Thalassotalea euphylliae]
MAIIVQKYGGTSVGSLSRIEAVAENIITTVRQGHQVVVVLSAMAGETNRLLAMAQQLDATPASRELDMLLASGEQVSISLLAIALVQRGISAISLLAHQVGIQTDNRFGAARIQAIDTQRLTQALSQEQVIVVAGFQGQDVEHNVTTLGRGGSDTSAVALAVALNAAEAQIFTDVDGVYSADPRIVAKAQRIPCLSFDEMLVMASLGAKVLQNRAVEYAFKHQMPIRVLSSFSQGEGTLVLPKSQALAESQSNNPVSSIVHDQQQALICLTDVADNAVSSIFDCLEKANVELDMVQLVGESSLAKQLLFTLNRDKLEYARNALQEITMFNKFGTIRSRESVAKISAVGIGLNSHTKVVGKIVALLASAEIDIELISTSEISCSVVIDETNLVQAAQILHSGFGLDSSN